MGMLYEPKYEDYLGMKFNLLTPIELLPREVDDENGRIKKDEGKKYVQLIKYICQCDCGNTSVVSRSALRDGTTKSCGCIGTGRPKGRKSCRKGFVYSHSSGRVGCLMPKLLCEKMKKTCCWDCDDYEGCKLACTNSPAKCGRYKG